MACIIYYQNLDYDQLPTSRKKAKIDSNLSSNSNSSYNNIPFSSTSNHQKQQIPDDSDYTQRNYTHKSPPKANNKRKNYTYNHSNINAPSSSNFETSTNGYGSSGQNNFSASYSSGSFVTYSNSSSTSNENEAPQSNFSPSYNTNSNSSSSMSPFSNNYPAQHSQKIFEAPNTQILLDTLKKYFKFDSFRENQLNAINATCMGLDTLILMPTGGGKSICYQLPAIVTRGVSIVVSPLKSLIDDQVTRLRTLNVKTSALSGETKDDDANDVYFDLKAPEPKHKLLYVTPEKINCSGALINLFKSLHKRDLLARFIIDEAHCVSMWGSDFRPDYRKLGKLRDLFHDVPIMALTATAPPKVRDDIFDQLKMNKITGKTFIQSFNRPNLKFEVRAKSKNCVIEICNLIRNHFKNQCGIIYCLSRSDCEKMAENLRDNGINSAPYHAGLSDGQRKKAFQAWSMGFFPVVCATIAFGMGIDKSDVRFVIHYSVPKSIEGYYQEAGRAGRDGQFASCILYFTKADLYRMRSMMSRGFGRTAADKNRDQANLEHILAYVENKNECRRAILLRYLGEEFNSSDCIKHPKTACDNCLSSKRKH